MFSLWSWKDFGLNNVTINIEITVFYGKHRNTFILFPGKPFSLSLLKKVGWILLLGFCTQGGGWNETEGSPAKPSWVIPIGKKQPSINQILPSIKLPTSPWPWSIFFLLQVEVFGAGEGDLPPAQCLPCPSVHQGPQNWWRKDPSGCRILPPAGSSLIRNNLHAEHQYDSYSQGFV